MGEDRTGLPGITCPAPPPLLTLSAATASNSSDRRMKVIFQGPRRVLLGLDITKFGKRLCFSSLSCEPSIGTLIYSGFFTTSQFFFHQLIAYGRVCPTSAHREKPSQAPPPSWLLDLQGPCFWSRSQISVSCQGLGHHFPQDTYVPLASLCRHSL